MTKRKLPRSLPIFLPHRKPCIGLGLVIFFSLMYRHCICHRSVSRAFQLRQWKNPNVSQERVWVTKSSGLEIGMMSYGVVSSTLRQPIPMLRSCCSRPGTPSHESCPTLPDMASALQTEPFKVDPSGSTSCTRPLASMTFLLVKYHSSLLPSHHNLD